MAKKVGYGRNVLGDALPLRNEDKVSDFSTKKAIVSPERATP